MRNHRTLASLLSALYLACGEQPPEPAPAATPPAPATSSVARLPSAVPPSAAPPPPAPLATGLAAAVAAIAPGHPSGPGLELLRAERDAAKGQERALFDRMVGLAERITAAGKDEAAIKTNGGTWLKDYAAICRDIAKSAPDDAALQADIAGTLFSIPTLATNMGLDPKPFEGLRTESMTMLDAALKRLNDARPYAAKASICQANNGDPLECMRLLAKCVDLQPKVPRCASELANMKADYARPYCEGADIHKDLAFFAAHADPAKPGGPPVAESKPAFVAQDFASLHEVEQSYSTQEWDDAKKAFGPQIEKKALALSVVIAPAKSAEFATWTEKLAAEKGSVAVRVGASELMTARIVSRIEGRMTLSGAIDKVCVKTSKRELPKDLAAKP